MDGNYILIWLVGASCVSAMVRAWKTSATMYRGWIIMAGAVLVLLGMGMFLFPSSAGYVGAAAWGFFVVMPSLATRLVWRWTMQQRYAEAWRASLVLRCLHPFGVERFRPQLLEASRWAQAGRMPECETILRRLIEQGGIPGRAARVLWCRLTGRWAELVEWVKSNVEQAAMGRDVGLLMAYLRALGETGERERMLWVYAQFGGALERAGHAPSRDLCRLMVLAFCGRRPEVENLLEDSAEWLPENAREFWLATAEQASGEEGASGRAQERLSRLLVCEKDAVARSAVERRLAQPAGAGWTGLDESALVLLRGIEAEQHETVELVERFGWREAYGTHVLVALNVTMFVLEILCGGSEKESVLYALGALSPQAVMHGEWWRMLAAMFLHYGPVHIVMNMAGLLLLGPFVEASLGRWRYAMAYVGSGLISMWIVVLLAQAGWIGDELLVGASGSIMGLVGATAVVWLRTWRAERSRSALRRLQRILMAIGLQVIFDLVTPQVSMAAHTSGVFAGALVAWVLTRNVTAEETSD